MSLTTAISQPAEAVHRPKPTVVLFHGAFAESSSWDRVVTRLLAKGFPVVAAANPLHGLRSDSDIVAAVFRSIHGPIVAVGHSYGGSVVTGAAIGNPNVQALVYVAGLAPQAGESAADISDRFPGSTLGPTLAAPIALPDGGKDLYIQRDKFHAQFAADLPEADAQLMAVTQRPVSESALNEPAGPAAWKYIPSWFIFGSLDKNITKAAHSFMAQRAVAKEAVQIEGASHVVMVSHPDEVVNLIEKAADFATKSPPEGLLPSAQEPAVIAASGLKGFDPAPVIPLPT